MKSINCAGCHKKVAEVTSGSKLRKGCVMLCENCNTMRLASDMKEKTKNPFKSDIFDFLK